LQYQWIRRTREVLFRYCDSIPSDIDCVRQMDGFGCLSIRDSHVHVADCYRIWLRVFGLGLEISGYDPSDYPGAVPVMAIIIIDKHPQNENVILPSVFSGHGFKLRGFERPGP
jgi:hypothetical protein